MSKKMCPKTSPNLNIAVHGVAAIMQFSPPIFRENAAGAYIEFYAFDPALGKMRRKVIKLNRIKGIVNRRKYAMGLLNRLNEHLYMGWNPWIAKDVSELKTIEEALERYENHVEKMFSSGYFRDETYTGYKSYLKILREYIATQKPIFYVYQFDKRFCVDFLDYIFIERNNVAQTRNNYLNFLRVLSGFLVEKGFLNSKPTDGIRPISKRLFQKERTTIPTKTIEKIAEYCVEHDKHFLLACYLLYYCFVRPVEMTRLKVEDFNVAESTLTLSADISKNKTTQVVTLPKKVLEYAVSLGVLSAPMSYYIFGEDLKPGSAQIDTKLFRDHWAKVRRKLKLKSEWKFYSLKDSGITELLDKNVSTLAVRDQARHSSLAITDVYTRKRSTANAEIMEHDGAL
jgi:integrase